MSALRALQASIAAVALLTLACPLLAMNCSDARVRKLAEDGRTIASIADKCELDTEEVEEILDAEQEDAGAVGASRQGLPSGTAVSACGCYGYVMSGYRQPYAECESGVVVAIMCPAMCPAGGYQWHNVCQ